MIIILHTNFVNGLSFFIYSNHFFTYCTYLVFTVDIVVFYYIVQFVMCISLYNILFICQVRNTSDEAHPARTRSRHLHQAAGGGA